MPDRDDEGRPCGRAASSTNLLGSGYGTNDTDSALFAAAVGRALLAEPNQLADAMGTIVPADLPEPYAYAWSLLGEIRDASVDPGESVCDAFAERAARPQPGMVPRFQPGPRTWAAKAMSAAADFGPGLPFAMRGLVGRGAIRAAEDAARRIQRACALGDTSDLAEIRAIVEQELPRLTAAVAGRSEALDSTPSPIPLSTFLAEIDEPVRYRIADVLTVGGRAVLAAQFKAGKTTMVGNCIRSLADGDPFLGQFEATPCRVTLIDDEMDARQLRRWLRAQGIVNTDCVRIVPLRGSVASFDLLDAKVRGQWAKVLRGTDVLIFDCLRPVLDALGLDEHRDAGRFLVAFDALLKEAGIGEAIVVHHMGHNGERSRGDSRIRDWPDVEWRLVRNGDEPNAPRFFSAFGRDVDLPETALVYDGTTRRLSMGIGSRSDAKASAALPAVLELLSQHEPLSGRQIEDALKDTEHARSDIREAVRIGVTRGEILTHDGPRRAVLHSSAPVRGSAPPVRQRTADDGPSECASAPHPFRGGALRTRPSDATGEVEEQAECAVNLCPSDYCVNVVPEGANHCERHAA